MHVKEFLINNSSSWHLFGFQGYFKPTKVFFAGDFNCSELLCVVVDNLQVKKKESVFFKRINHKPKSGFGRVGYGMKHGLAGEKTIERQSVDAANEPAFFSVLFPDLETVSKTEPVHFAIGANHFRGNPRSRFVFPVGGAASNDVFKCVVDAV